MKVLVTGAAGFIGSHYVRHMLAGDFPGYEDAEITVVDKLSYAAATGNLPVHAPRLSLVRADVAEPDPLTDVVAGHDVVVHFAAESHVDRSVFGPREFMISNVVGTQNLLECCRHAGVARIVHVSTDEVYGTISSGSWTEDCPLRPNSPYAASKAASDLIARAYHRTYGLDVSTTRCSNNYGRYQLTEKLIPLFVTRLLDGEQVPLYGNGDNVREWLHVNDHCRAIQLVLEHGRAGEIYNIGGGAALANRELTERLLELCGAGPDRIRHVPDRPGHDFRYSVDDRKIREELGYRPQVPFDQGLADVVRWYRDNRAWWEPLRTRSRLPDGASSSAPALASPAGPVGVSRQ